MQEKMNKINDNHAIHEGIRACGWHQLDPWKRAFTVSHFWCRMAANKGGWG